MGSDFFSSKVLHMKLGFTGTRRGMTTKQAETFQQVLKSCNPGEFHHGDCIGADDEAADIAHDFLLPDMIVVHPPTDDTHRAFNGSGNERMREPKTHFARNRDIVDETDMLIAAPYESEHQKRGGTWYTVDYAKKKRRRVIIIWPDGFADTQVEIPGDVTAGETNSMRLK
jgi:hypothetical protein